MITVSNEVTKRTVTFDDWIGDGIHNVTAPIVYIPRLDILLVAQADSTICSISEYNSVRFASYDCYVGYVELQDSHEIKDDEQLIIVESLSVKYREATA